MNKKTVCFVILLLIVIWHPSAVFGQSAKEALLALKKLEVKVETGISYIDYSSALADAKFPVKLFLETSESKNDANLAASFQKIIDGYEFASSVWNVKFNCTRGVMEFMHSGCNADIFNKVKKEYPSVPIQTIWGQESFSIDYAVLMIWQNASKEIQVASDLLSKTELKAQTAKLEFDAMKKENEVLQNKIDSLKKELEDLKTENDSIRKANANIKTENDNLKSKIATKKKK